MNWRRTGAFARYESTAADCAASSYGAVPKTLEPSTYETRIFSAGSFRPASASAAWKPPRELYASCVLEKMRAPSGVTSATAHEGPIGRCPLYCIEYVCETGCAAPASGLSTLPRLLYRPGVVCPPAPWLRLCVPRFATPGIRRIGAHRPFSWAAAWIASYSLGATTPRKLPIWRTFTFGMWLTDFGSTDITFGAVPSPYAPCPRGRTTLAWSIPGSRMLWTYV